MTIKLKTKKTIQGYTFIELLLYISIITIFISGAIRFAWNIVYGQVKSDVQREVVQNLRLASKRIIYEIRNATSINSIAANEVCLEMYDSTYNPTRIYVDQGRLRIGWGGGGSNCTSTTNDEVLTTNEVIVSDLTFTDLTSPASESINVGLNLTIEYSNQSTRSEFEFNQTYTTSVELRSN
jgi:type II secretory pathway pseudopilin PulG